MNLASHVTYNYHQKQQERGGGKLTSETWGSRFRKLSSRPSLTILSLRSFSPWFLVSSPFWPVEAATFLLLPFAPICSQAEFLRKSPFYCWKFCRLPIGKRGSWWKFFWSSLIRRLFCRFKKWVSLKIRSLGYFSRKDSILSLKDGVICLWKERGTGSFWWASKVGEMIQLLFLVLFAEGVVALLLMVKIGPLRELAMRMLDQLKTGRGPATVKTLACTLSVLFLSSMASILKIQSRGAKLGTVTPMDQVLWRNHLLEASLIGIIPSTLKFLLTIFDLIVSFLNNCFKCQKLKMVGWLWIEICIVIIFGVESKL